MSAYKKHTGEDDDGKKTNCQVRQRQISRDNIEANNQFVKLLNAQPHLFHQEWS